MAQLGIVGAGPGGAALLTTFMSTPEIKIIGIADPDSTSPGRVLARKHQIFATADFHDLLKRPGKKIIFDATGVPAVARELEQSAEADREIIIVCPDAAKLIWQMIEAKEAVNHALIQESSTLLSFIEGGLEHLEVLNNEHGEALQQAVQKIEALAKTTVSSHALLKETEKIIHLIKNIADKTHILGINAAIESARVGEQGRGFGVVADSIRELAANSVQSVQSVSGTIKDIHSALESIKQDVDQVVADIQLIESNQVALTQELHTSLEEMITSAEKLKAMAGEGIN
ncbi:MAG: hypothetical protein GX335_01890 [Firmicutes bacterium]|nr:hypothetical protein [Bacillota bacterium]